MKQDKEQWKDEVLNSLEGMQKAESNPFLFTRIQETIAQITLLKEQRIDFTYQYLQDLKNICTPEQLAQFPKIVDLLKNDCCQFLRKKCLLLRRISFCFIVYNLRGRLGRVNIF